MRGKVAALMVGLGLMAGAMYAAGWGAVRYAGSLVEAPVPGAETVVSITIPEGASTADVAELLHQKELIRAPLAFRYMARRLGVDARIRPGEYRLGPGMDAATILGKLARGEAVVYRFTVPEGLTVARVAAHLAEQGLVDREAFLAAARRPDLAREWLPAGAELPEPLEGYLFPFTYEYRPGMPPEAYLELMVNQFRTVLTPGYLARARELKLSVHQLVTLASIVEKEARVPAERPRIAGVYWNRLREGMKLEADPTVRYALGLPPEEDIAYTDLEADHPYNTYRRPGLPPGPIANPGEAAIRAVLWPDEHQFLFFVAKGDGSGEHAFSETYEQHQAAMAQAAASQQP